MLPLGICWVRQKLYVVREKDWMIDHETQEEWPPKLYLSARFK